MIRQLIITVCWLISCGALYFFENNTGTRVVLIMAAAFPLIFRAFQISKPDEGTEPRMTKRDRPDKGPVPTALNEPGDIREYAVGDPVSRIHWKLTAKTGKLLIREDSAVLTLENGNTLTPEAWEEAAAAPKKMPVSLLIVSGAIVALCLLPIAVVPDARHGFSELGNRLFSLSESVNRYVYERFSVPDGQSVLFASILLITAATAWLALTLVSKNRVPALLTAAALAFAQVYFGLSLPAWANIFLFTLLGVKLFINGITLKRCWLCCIAAAIALAVVMVCCPGVLPRTEAASERVRDFFGESAGAESQTVSETPANGFETRHVNTQSLLTGAGESVTGKDYRLVTVDEQQISMPHFIDYLRAVLMALLGIAVVILPFAPFVLLNARRRKTRAYRAEFESGDVSKSVRAMFLHVVSLLQAMRLGAGNALFINWPRALSEKISKDYAERFGRCAELFEEAEYSDHALEENARAEMRAFVDTTENELYSKADLRTQLRIKYVECLVE